MGDTPLVMIPVLLAGRLIALSTMEGARCSAQGVLTGHDASESPQRYAAETEAALRRTSLTLRPIRLGTGLIGTIAALVLGLRIASAKGSPFCWRGTDDVRSLLRRGIVVLADRM